MVNLNYIYEFHGNRSILKCVRAVTVCKQTYTAGIETEEIIFFN